MLAKTLAGLSLLTLIACAADTAPIGDDETSQDNADPSKAAGTICTGADCNAPATTTTPENDEGTCPANSQLVYVATNTVTPQGPGSASVGPPIELWSYWPPTGEFKKIGTPDCLRDTAIQNMSVDRNGFAWIIGNSGQIFKVNTKDATCAGATTAKLGLVGPAIAFVGNTAKSVYVFGHHDDGGKVDASQLRIFDTKTETITDVGAPTLGGIGSWGAMTADGNGNLFYLEVGFDHVSRGQNIFYQLDPKTGKVMNTTNLGWSPYDGSSLGLAYFGTQFFVFKDAKVYRFDPATKLVAQVGTPPWSLRRVAGAGQSTCVANTAIPQGTKPPVVN